VLASLLECEAHGFRIAALLAPDGELGQIWRLKLAFLLRLECSLKPLLQAQEAVYRQILRELEAQQPLQATGVQRVSLLWRLEMARASLRFVEQIQEPEDATHN
jgi:hypothetical protein